MKNYNDIAVNDFLRLMLSKQTVSIVSVKNGAPVWIYYGAACDAPPIDGYIITVHAVADIINIGITG